MYWTADKLQNLTLYATPPFVDGTSTIISSPPAMAPKIFPTEGWQSPVHQSQTLPESQPGPPQLAATQQDQQRSGGKKDKPEMKQREQDLLVYCAWKACINKRDDGTELNLLEFDIPNELQTNRGKRHEVDFELRRRIDNEFGKIVHNFHLVNKKNGIPHLPTNKRQLLSDMFQRDVSVVTRKFKSSRENFMGTTRTIYVEVKRKRGTSKESKARLTGRDTLDKGKSFEHMNCTVEELHPMGTSRNLHQPDPTEDSSDTNNCAKDDINDDNKAIDKDTVVLACLLFGEDPLSVAKLLSLSEVEVHRIIREFKLLPEQVPEVLLSPTNLVHKLIDDKSIVKSMEDVVELTIQSLANDPSPPSLKFQRQLSSFSGLKIL